MSQSKREGQAAPGIFPAGYVGRMVTDDFDKLAYSARAWRQHYTKLSAGPFHGKVLQAHTPALQLGFVHFRSSLLVTGAVPAGGRTFALLPASGRTARVSGRVMENGTVGTRSDRDELYFVNAPDTTMMVLSIEHGLLDRGLAMIFGSDWRELGGNSPILRIKDADAAHAGLRRVLAAMYRHPEHLTRPESAMMLEEQVFMTFFSRLDLPAEHVHPADRLRLARRADDYLRSRQAEPVSIAELCAATGARERTLHVACRENFGLPPAAYLRTLRLHGARRDLRELGPATTVTETATRWGFFHFGEFAGAYRRLFGESPSQTVRATAR